MGKKQNLIEDTEKENIVNVSCYVCKREIPCPRNMLETDRHICYYCFEEKEGDFSEEERGKMHIAMPTAEFDEKVAEDMVNDLVEEVFEGAWQERKEELKELSKKDLAQEMFGSGAYIALAGFFRQMREEEIKGNEKRGVQK